MVRQQGDESAVDSLVEWMISLEVGIAEFSDLCDYVEDAEWVLSEAQCGHIRKVGIVGDGAAK